MSEAKSNESDWVRAWLEQQRAQLQHARAAAADGSAQGRGDDDLRERWLDVLGTWHSGWVAAVLAAQGTGLDFSTLSAGLAALWPARAQAQLWQDLSAAQGECRKLQQEFCTLLVQIQADALALLEARVREREAADDAVGTQRELYDLWIECGEQAYSRVAHSEVFCRMQAELGNAMLRLRASQQALIEEGLKHFDLPTRAELNTVHRQLRELRARVAALEAQAAGAGTDRQQ